MTYDTILNLANLLVPHSLHTLSLSLSRSLSFSLTYTHLSTSTKCFIFTEFPQIDFLRSEFSFQIHLLPCDVLVFFNAYYSLTQHTHTRHRHNSVRPSKLLGAAETLLHTRTHTQTHTHIQTYGYVLRTYAISSPKRMVWPIARRKPPRRAEGAHPTHTHTDKTEKRDPHARTHARTVGRVFHRFLPAGSKSIKVVLLLLGKCCAVGSVGILFPFSQNTPPSSIRCIAVLHGPKAQKKKTIFRL